MTNSVTSAVIADFGVSLGIKDLDWNANNAVVLKIGKIGELAIEHLDTYPSCILVSLARNIETPNRDALCRILEVGHPKNKGRAIHAGMNGRGDLIFTIRLEEREFTSAEIHSCIDALDAAHGSVESYVTQSRSQ